MADNTNINATLTNKQNLLVKKLTVFFYKNKFIHEMIPIINGTSPVSLRTIDWFVTNYAKKINIIYSVDNSQFNVYIEYKQQLKAYSKKQFDPFCRRDRINFFYTEKDYIVTTVGQLNFFKWAIQNNVLQFVKDNLKKIELDMNSSLRKSSENRKKNKKKRQELSDCATKRLNKHNIKVTLFFE